MCPNRVYNIEMESMREGGTNVVAMAEEQWQPEENLSRKESTKIGRLGDWLKIMVEKHRILPNKGSRFKILEDNDGENQGEIG